MAAIKVKSHYYDKVKNKGIAPSSGPKGKLHRKQHRYNTANKHKGVHLINKEYRIDFITNIKTAYLQLSLLTQRVAHIN